VVRRGIDQGWITKLEAKSEMDLLV